MSKSTIENIVAALSVFMHLAFWVLLFIITNNPDPEIVDQNLILLVSIFSPSFIILTVIIQRIS